MPAWLDTLTEVLRSTLRLAGAHYPLHILAGLAGGIVLDGALEVAGAEAPAGSWLRALAGLNAVYSMALGVFVATAVMRLSGNRLGEKTERELDLIERVIERGELSQVDRRLAWRNVLTKAMDAFQPGSPQFDVQRAAEEAVRETRE